MPIRIVLADDHQGIRDHLRALLERETDMAVVAEVEDGSMAVETAVREQPDVVVMDVIMPRMNGVEATRRIRDQLPDVKVLALSAYAVQHLVGRMLQAGASGYVVKTTAGRELVPALRAVVAGQIYMGAEVADPVPAEIMSSGPRASSSGPPR